MRRYLERSRITLGRRPSTAVIIVGIAYVLYLSARLAAFGWDASVFIEAGDQYVDPAKTPEEIRIQRHSPGYDGQFYYALAMEPWSDSSERQGVALDKSAYRQQRILYPLVVSTVTLGRDDLAPEGLILVNLLAILVATYLGARFVPGWKGVFLGVAIGMYPGFLLSTTRDLAEPLAGALVVGSLLSLRNRTIMWATGWMILAVLTRETTLMIPLAAGGVWIWQRLTGAEEPLVPLVFFLLPVGLWIGWQLVLLDGTDTLAVAAGGNNLTFPFAGIITALSQVRRNGSVELLRWLAGAGLVAIVALFGLASFRLNRAAHVEKVSFALYALLVTALSHVVWIEDWAFLRASTELFLLGSILLVMSRWGSWLRFASVGLWLGLATVNLY